jgi:hypothetical protein
VYEKASYAGRVDNGVIDEQQAPGKTGPKLGLGLG